MTRNELLDQIKAEAEVMRKAIAKHGEPSRFTQYGIAWHRYAEALACSIRDADNEGLQRVVDGMRRLTDLVEDQP
jgi:hypothetical protein